MKLDYLHTADIERKKKPKKDLDYESNDDEADEDPRPGNKVDFDWTKKFVVKPMQSMSGGAEHPTSPTAFTGAAPTR